MPRDNRTELYQVLLKAHLKINAANVEFYEYHILLSRGKLELAVFNLCWDWCSVSNPSLAKGKVSSH